MTLAFVMPLLTAEVNDLSPKSRAGVVLALFYYSDRRPGGSCTVGSLGDLCTGSERNFTMGLLYPH